MAVDRISLGFEDAEMESPQAQAEETIQDSLMTPTGTLGAPVAGDFTLVFHGGGFKHVALTTHPLFHTFEFSFPQNGTTDGHSLD